MARPLSDIAGRTASLAAAAALCAAPLLSTPAQAEGSDGPTGSFALELNNLEDIDGACRLSFVANNRTGVALEQTSYEVVVFDDAGAVAQRLILEFGRLPEDKTKVVQFLLDRGCDRISRLLLNDVEECTASDGAAVPYCLDALDTSARVDVMFGA